LEQYCRLTNCRHRLLLLCAYAFEILKYRGKSLHDTIPLGSLFHHIVAMACATWVQYSLRAHTTSNAIVLQLLSIAITGSIGIGGLLNTAYRLSKFLLSQHAHLEQRLCQVTTLLAWSRTVAISGTWILLSMHCNHRRHVIFGKLGLLAGPVFMLVYFLFYAQWHCVFTAHRKCGGSAGPKLEAVDEATLYASVLENWPSKFNVGLCAAVFAFTSYAIGTGLIGTYGHAFGSFR
jgi:hypothetical protein